jgi:hypothetical protein
MWHRPTTPALKQPVNVENVQTNLVSVMGKKFQQQGYVVITKTVYGSTAEFLRQIQDKTQRK